MRIFVFIDATRCSLFVGLTYKRGMMIKLKLLTHAILQIHFQSDFKRKWTVRGMRVAFKDRHTGRWSKRVAVCTLGLCIAKVVGHDCRNRQWHWSHVDLSVNIALLLGKNTIILGQVFKGMHKLTFNATPNILCTHRQILFATNPKYTNIC